MAAQHPGIGLVETRCRYALCPIVIPTLNILAHSCMIQPPGAYDGNLFDQNNAVICRPSAPRSVFTRQAPEPDIRI
jgi:hypothetical protein